MIQLFSIPLFFVSLMSFAQQDDLMFRVYDEVEDECGYVNAKGETLIPIGQCFACFSDSLTYAVVIKRNHRGEGFPAFDAKGNNVFNVFPYDNGPDYVEDGTFRIIKEGKIGYANVAGEIIIPPKYEAAFPFENGRAKVSLHADKESDGEHSWWVNTDWFYIDKKGNKIEE